mgnify:FL=1
MNVDKYKDLEIEKYLEYLKYERKLSDNTYQSYKNNLKQFKKYLIDNDIVNSSKDVSTEMLKEYLYQLNLSNKSKSHYLTVLKSYYSFLTKEGVIKNNPTNAIKMPKIEKKLPNYLTIEEVDKLLDIRLEKPTDYRNKAMLELLYATGMRISELTNLKLSQVDFDDDIVRVLGKGKKERTIPLNDTAIFALKEYINDYRPFLLKLNTSEYIFINNFGNKISRQGFFKILKKLCVKAEINKEVSPHTLRHSFATHLLNNGADLRIIQELLGHENLVTTEIYAHLQNQKIKDDYENHPRSKIN